MSLSYANVVNICILSNGGPVEDWVNLAKMSSDQTPVVIINGALDKVSI